MSMRFEMSGQHQAVNFVVGYAPSRQRRNRRHLRTTQHRHRPQTSTGGATAHLLISLKVRARFCIAASNWSRLPPFAVLQVGHAECFILACPCSTLPTRARSGLQKSYDCVDFGNDKCCFSQLLDLWVPLSRLARG